MAFDWTNVPAGSLAYRSPDGKWRQSLDEGNSSGGGVLDNLDAFLAELAKWGFDSLTVAADAEAWLTRMVNEHLVLVSHYVFERALCGIEDERHKHSRYCAGPRVIKRLGRVH